MEDHHAKRDWKEKHTQGRACCSSSNHKKKCWRAFVFSRKKVVNNTEQILEPSETRVSSRLMRLVSIPSPVKVQCVIKKQQSCETLSGDFFLFCGNRDRRPSRTRADIIADEMLWVLGRYFCGPSVPLSDRWTDKMHA